MREALSSGLYGLGFHGSAQSISQFLDSRVGGGADTNSALGLFMSHVPMNALEYALNANELGEGFEVMVYVVAFPTRGKVKHLSVDEYYGFLEDDERSPAEHFASMRAALIGEGYDQITCDTGEDAVTIALRPSQCKIIKVLDQAAVELLDSSPLDVCDYVALYDHLNLTYHSNPKQLSEEELAP